MDGMMENRTPKELIAANLLLLQKIYGKTRKDVCRDLDIPYTTYCDWVNAKTYPRIDNLESLGYYFRIGTRDFFIDIEHNRNMELRLLAYAREFGVFLGGEEKIKPEKLFTVEDYNETPEGYPVELINGSFYVMESPNSRHQSIVMELCAEIRNHIREKKLKCRVFPGPFDVELPTKLPTVVVPDVTVICDPKVLTEKRCEGTPDWVIEILSPSTKNKDLTVKPSVYKEAGVREYWIIDQFNDEVWVYKREGKAPAFYYEEPTIYKFSDTIPVGICEDLTVCPAELDFF